MGCTSSAPSTIHPNAQTAADKSIQFEEETSEYPSIEVDVADIGDENQANETKMLPSCDSFEEAVQLVRNNKTSTSLATEKDVPANGHIMESESAKETPENPKGEVKIPKLELLMDKVFEKNHHLTESVQKVHESEHNPLDPNDENTENNDNETGTAIDQEFCDNPESEVEKKSPEAEEKPEESSPSQSQSSRATRWEALADIAAELPPSLAVDPITGQIYQIAINK